MRKLAIPANALVVSLGVTLLLGFGVVESLISPSGRAGNESSQVQPTAPGNTRGVQSSTQAQSPTQAEWQ